ncbi:MAG: glycosyltransferase [Halioglobus sp.]
MKISIIIARFSISGVPLAQIRFAGALARRGHNVSLIVGYVDKDCQLPDVAGVKIYIWNQPRARGMVMPLMQFLRDEKPDVVFSAEDHLNGVVLLAAILSRSKTKISGSSRILPTDRHAYSNVFLSKGWILKQFMKAVMWRANALTCVSLDMVGYYRNIFKNAPHVCVYNIIKDQKSICRSEESVDHEWLLDKRHPVIVSAGTLANRKGFADLIRAFSIIEKNRTLRLIILGDGHLRDDLQALVSKLGLADRVSMPGNVPNPLKYFSHSDVFVLSSYAEGMPNVLIEAMICGCTPVATDCPTGPRELLQKGKFGYLVPMHDPESMAVAIQQALDNPIPRTLLTEAVQPFEENAVIERHFEALGLCQKSST